MKLESTAIAELVGALDWPEFFLDGACAGMDPTLFDDEDRRKSNQAKRICQGCPVQTDCAQWGISNEYSGIWGGLDAKDRARARRGKGKFITMEKRREDVKWLQDMYSNKTAEELARKYGTSVRTIYRWRKKVA